MSERVAIVDGLRTPFAKRGDALGAFDAVDLEDFVSRHGPRFAPAPALTEAAQSDEGLVPGEAS